MRLSIARSLRLALIALTVVLAVIAAIGVAQLYSARQSYERTLGSSSRLDVAVANLDSAAVLQDEVLRDVRGRAGAADRSQARSAYARDAAAALAAADGQPAARALLVQAISLQAQAARLTAAGRLAAADAPSGPIARAGALLARLQAREQARSAQARARARSDSRRALVIVAIAGALALLGALALIAALVAGMRAPLDELVRATRELATGQLARRVKPSGPRELRELGASFNAMAGELADAQRRLDQQRQRLAVTIESLGDGLLVTESGRVVAANPRAQELIPELPVGARVEGEGSPLPPLDQALGADTTLEHRSRTLEVTAAPLGTDADASVWTVRDVSERARLERAKSEFIATASHELRSPLTSIKGFVELLARQSDGMSERQREFVEIILRSTERLVELVGDLLDVARIDADRVEISPRPIDLGEAIREVVELMGPRIEAKRQQLGVYIAPTLPLALADAGRVRQIVANLLTNAHLYTPEDGRIHVGAEADRAWVQLVVADSGVGMSPEQSERVFERFYRGPAPGRSSPGTGLGLAIVKSLIDMQGGQIDVFSEPGRGTTFRVRLPAALPGIGAAGSLEPIRGRRVLIVDDEREVAELIAGQLAPLEVEAQIATDGEQALAMLREGHFDAITLDILMPGLDGFQVLRRMREDPELRALPVVFVSVFSGRRELAGEWKVSKPIDADELREVLAAAVAAGRSRVLVVGRVELQWALAPALDDMGIDHEWVTSGAAAARACRERRFEIALVDIGLRNPQAVLQALDLRGRRTRRAVILFSDGAATPPAGVQRLGIEVVPVQQAAVALLAALRGERAAQT
jgi:signal transduction histidine kinase/DNA-binding response OmpR family regulator